MEGKIKAVLFDLGGVFIKHKNVAFLKETKALIASPGRLDWSKPGAVKLLRQFELGKVSPRQFYKGLCPFMRDKISFEQFKEIWTNIFVWRPKVAEFAKQLRAAGYKIAIVSNCDAFSYPKMIGHYGLAPYIDFAAASFKVHHRKPEREIFMAAVNGLKLRPENCVFVDDLSVFTKAARLLGLKAVQYKNLQQVKKALAGLGVRPKIPARRRPKPKAVRKRPISRRRI